MPGDREVDDARMRAESPKDIGLRRRDPPVPDEHLRRGRAEPESFGSPTAGSKAAPVIARNRAACQDRARPRGPRPAVLPAQDIRPRPAGSIGDSSDPRGPVTEIAAIRADPDSARTSGSRAGSRSRPSRPVVATAVRAGDAVGGGRDREDLRSPSTRHLDRARAEVDGEHRRSRGLCRIQRSTAPRRWSRSRGATRRRRRRSSLDGPAVRPRSSPRWTNSGDTKTGSTSVSAPAAIAPQLIVSTPMKLTTPTVAGVVPGAGQQERDEVLAPGGDRDQDADGQHARAARAAGRPGRRRASAMPPSTRAASSSSIGMSWKYDDAHPDRERQQPGHVGQDQARGTS